MTIQFKGLRAALVVLAATFGLMACGHLSVETGDQPRPPTNIAWKVAVVPFENFTNHQNAGMVGAELTLSELAKRELFKIVPFEQVRRVMEKMEIKESERIRNTQAEDIGKTVGADLVLIGSVAEYGYQYGLREEPSVSMNMRLVRVSDGVVVWTYSAGQVGRGVFSRESVSMVAFAVIEQLVNALAVRPNQL